MRKVLFLLITCLFVNVCFGSEELSKQATAFYSDNNYNKTMDLVLQIDENKRTAQDWLILGNLMDEKKQKQEAVFMYQRAINTDKKYYKAYYNMANVYLSDEKYGMAIDNYKKALKYDNKNPYIHYNLGCAYLKAGQIKKAKSCFNEAIYLKNDVPEFHYNIAYVYKMLNNQKLANVYLNNYNKLTEND